MGAVDQLKDTWIFNPINSTVATTNQWQSNSKHCATVQNPSCCHFHLTPPTKHSCILKTATRCVWHIAVIFIPTAGQCAACSTNTARGQTMIKWSPNTSHFHLAFPSGKQPVDTKGINWGRWLDTSIHHILVNQSDLILPVLGLNSSLLVCGIT